MKPQITHCTFQDGAFTVTVESPAGTGTLQFPATSIQAFRGLDAADLAEFRIDPAGTAILLKSNNGGVTLAGIVSQVLGIHSAASVAHLGGQANRGKTSEAKAAAARSNGAKGGRPRKAT